MTRKKIALYCDSFNERVGQSESYVKFFSTFGEVILITAQNDFDYWIKEADILALPGGADVDSNRYGERPDYGISRTNPHYEYLDLFLLTPWLHTGKPIVGICRGLQTLNVVCGGSLIQDINGHIGGADRTSVQHNIFMDDLEVPDANKPNEITVYDVYGVNSYHHQAINVLAPGFEMLAWSPIYKNCPSLRNKKYYHNLRECFHYEKLHKNAEYTRTSKRYLSIPEIIRHTTLPYIAFQYHPEDLNCPLAAGLIQQTLSRYENENK